MNWIIRRDLVDKNAVRLSNYVTDYVNETTIPGIQKMYLQESIQLSSGEYLLQVVV